MSKNYYQILGIELGASPDEIKRAYRRLALVHHPDRGGDVSKFQQIQEAYSVLNDPQKRREYDHPTRFSGFDHMPGGFDDFLRNLNDFFSREQNQYRSLNFTTTITLEQAYKGSELVANVNFPDGTEKLINVKIPPGVQHGMTLKIKDTHAEVSTHDIYLTIFIQPHDKFRIIGNDLHHEVEINVFQAMLGDVIKIKSINGNIINCEIQPGTQYGMASQYTGMGMPNVNDPRFFGNLVITYKIIIPKQLTEKQRNLIRQAMV